MTPDEQALVISLVRAQMIDDPEGCSWVAPYAKIRWSHAANRCVREVVGGHYRRKANVRRGIDSLGCVCKQQELFTTPQIPIGRARNR